MVENLKEKNVTWYEEYIEEPIRDTVKLLRDNGFNTECSCGHKMYVQCQFIVDGEIQRLHNLLFNSGYTNYRIIAQLICTDGHHYTTLEVEIMEGDKAFGFQ